MSTLDTSDVTAPVPTPEDQSPATTRAKQPAAAPQRERVKIGKGGYTWGVGRRKSAVARVRVRPGDGKFIINGNEIDKHFTETRDRESVVAPLKKTNTEGKLDVFVSVRGGGYTGQAGAVLLGVARALKGYDASLEPILRENDYLTRDPREVERKKYGQPGARKRFQFSKR